MTAAEIIQLRILEGMGKAVYDLVDLIKRTQVGSEYETERAWRVYQQPD